MTSLPHIWLRTPETDDQARVRSALDDIEACFGTGAIRVVVTASSLTCEESIS